jgi:hypothetical protein
MQLGPPPQAGDSTEELWRYVAELFKVVRAQGNIRVSIVSPYPTHGKNEISDTENVIIIS